MLQKRVFAVKLGWCAFAVVLPAACSQSTPLTALEPAPAAQQLQIVTDATWTIDGKGAAVPVAPRCIPGGAWAPPAGTAVWIWSSACLTTDTESHHFIKTFDAPFAPAFAHLQLAADNYAFVSIDGKPVPAPRPCPAGVGAVPSAVACTHSQITDVDVREWLGTAGRHTIDIEVHNWSVGAEPGWDNPAGLMAQLTLCSLDDCQSSRSQPFP